MNTETAEQPVVDPARARVLVAPDRDAEFVDFVASAGPYLHRTAYLLTGDPHQAEELVQATFERTYRAWARARTGEPRAYARRILMNLRIDGWRKDRRSGVTDDGVVPLTPVPDHAEGVAVRDELGRALRALPPGQRRVVVMRHLLDLPEAQVAEELGISVGTVKSTNARGLARLRSLLSASAVDAVPAYRADAHDVLLTARAAVRRRRVARGAVAGVLAVVLGLLLVGPVHVPGVGPVVLPGSEWLRHVLGIDGRHGLSDLPFPEPADDAVCGGPLDPAARAVPVDDVSASWGDITITTVVRVTDAHVVAPCADVAVDHVVRTGDRVVADAATLGARGSVVGWSDSFRLFDGDRLTGPLTLRALAPDGGRLRTADVATTRQVAGRWPQAFGLVRQGDRAAWFATPNTQVTGTLPWALRTLDDDGSVVTVSDSTTLVSAEAGEPALSDDAVWWTTTSSVAGPVCGGVLHVAMRPDLTTPHPDQARRVCAIGSSPDGVVVASAAGEGPASGQGEGTVFLLLAGPAMDDARPLLSVDSGLLDLQPVTAVGYDAGRLAFASGGLLYVVDVEEGTGYQVRGVGEVDAIDVSAGTVAWSSPGGPARVLTGEDDALSLFTLPGDMVTVGVDGDRVAWTALDDAGGSLTVGRLRW
ncbi:SigE family RNA polymerase sigma factor [Promicromonospora thailandica]|uniref:RNA polymerase sigma-70 factor, sigma-E family n=1 Tax=Promicromonospora thailandica TaxID=765201 RepID=A0A9X2JYN9_9MICO|nr:SigE family RNA polymerase sigma factor [Promicromonospora thailandica]MCP2265249.1 RNA polymerase sigma-70 factor, sigma-E family [Promicromonospora thailandica]